MKLRMIFVSLIVLGYTSCDQVRDNCTQDEELKVQIFNSIKIVKMSVEGMETEFWDRAFACKSLDLLTDQRGSYMPLSDIGYLYESEELFEKDLERWLEWYETNKCSLTKTYVDSLFIEFNKTDTINWPNMVL